MISLDSRIERELREIQQTLSADGTLLSRQQLQKYYDTFRLTFGPEVLRDLNGEDLLERIHDHSNHDSLVYWLEFKNDATFPSVSFGGIAGGSALKFGIYRRAENGAWATKGTGATSREISLAEAIDIARRHRDQLLAAVGVLAKFHVNGSDSDYEKLQRDLADAAPDVENTAWGHKYLSLLFPQLLEDFHVETYQRYHLARLLQLPSHGDAWPDGRYVCAGRFVSIAEVLDLSIHQLSSILGKRNGLPRSYWRVGVTDENGAPRKYWPTMREESVVAIGWPAVGDLSAFPYTEKSKQVVGDLVRSHYPNTPSAVGNSASQLLQFAAKMEEGDRVLVAAGQNILGIGEVTGPYTFTGSGAMPHTRSVRWRSLTEWKTADREGLRRAVGTIRDFRTEVDVERRILNDEASAGLEQITPRQPGAPSPSGVPTSRVLLPRLSGVPGRIQAVLERKSQAILFGPPGTGKTFWALNTARELAASRAFGVSYAKLDAAQKSRVTDVGDASTPLVRTVSFHPEYGYEDFIEGFRPRTAPAGGLTFELIPGAFRKLCDDAIAAPEFDFFLIIDEINRGDVPRIFGELLMLLERDKRGESVILPMSGCPFRIPTNVYVIGTMNTADRSIALLDVALRRRFGFVELMPDYSLLKDASIGGLPLGRWLEALNGRVREHGGNDARNRQIGQAFLLQRGSPIATVEQLAAALREDIVPLLEEYCYDDFGRLTELLGPSLIDSDRQCVKDVLFDAARGADLIAALLSPEISTTAAAVAADSAESVEEEDEASISAADAPGDDR